jgi:hypothetical protein
MTDYADVPAANALHAESEQVGRALAMLNGGGTMVQFTVAPTPPAPGMMPPTQMPVSITAPAGTVTQAMIDDLVAWLTIRQSDLTAQLAALGVTSA